MPNPVEGLLEVCEDMVEVLLVQKMFLTEDPLCGAPACSEACLLFSDNLLRLWLQSVLYDLQRDFAWVTNEADRSVVLALLQVTFLGKCNDQALGPWGPICHILVRIVVRVVSTSSPPAWTSFAGMLSTPADFPFFNDCTAASTSLRGMGCSSSMFVWG